MSIQTSALVWLQTLVINVFFFNYALMRSHCLLLALNVCESVQIFIGNSGTVARALAPYQCGLGFESQSWRHMWVELVAGSHPCSVGFLLCSPKPTFLNSNSTWKTVDKEPLLGYATANSHLFISLFLFIYLFIHLLESMRAQTLALV